MRWGIVETCGACRLNYRTLYLNFDGVVVKLSAMLDQVLEVGPRGDLREPNRDEHVVGIQTAIGKAFATLEGVERDSVTCLAQNAGCPVCGLSEELSEQPLSMALFDSIENHEAAVNTLREEITLLQEPSPESQKLRLV